MNTSKRLKKLTISSLVLMVMLILPFHRHPLLVLAARYPTTGTDVVGVGTVTWTNPGRVVGNDNSYATVTLNSSTTSHYLQGTNFGFTIPTAATITGIVVEIGRFSSGRTSPLFATTS